MLGYRAAELTAQEYIFPIPSRKLPNFISILLLERTCGPASKEHISKAVHHEYAPPSPALADDIAILLPVRLFTETPISVKPT